MSTSSTSPPPRRTAVSFSSAGSSPRSSISKGATARSAVSSPRTASFPNGTAAKRQSLKGTTSSTPVQPSPLSEQRDALVVSLKRETEEKERLLLQVQDKDQMILNLTTENSNLVSGLNAAETRLGEMYADQARMEDDLSARVELVEKLRAQVREIEKEKRDLQRRYAEQTSSFDAERQSFYDNEQHLKSRIQSLTQARKHPVPLSPTKDMAETEPEPEEPPEGNEDSEDQRSEVLQDQVNQIDEDSEPAEMTALRMELSTLATSHASLETTLKVLQTQVVDLTRVNNLLQEDNESYKLLLTEKTLSGQFDILQHMATAGSDDGDDTRSVRSSARSTLDPVDEEGEQEDDQRSDPDRGQDIDDKEEGSELPGRPSRRSRGSPAPRGETLADLPITGPGLDLAAELGRAENKDILEGRIPEERDRQTGANKGRKKKGTVEATGGRKFNDTLDVPNSIEALRSEVKSLKDANKALSLYASKIIDRIISQEGFEHVLSVDFDKLPATPGPQSTMKTTFESIRPPVLPPRKERPQSAFFGRLTGSTNSPPSEQTEAPVTSNLPLSQPLPNDTTKHQRRSLSFDWKSFSVFGGNEKKPERPNLRPLTLRTGSNTVVTTRKLDNLEDEDDRRERERLNATMKLMGIEPGPKTAVPIFTNKDALTSQDGEPLSPSSGWRSFWRNKQTASDGGSVHSTSSAPQPLNLTHEALEEAEAQNSLAALDAREKVLSQQIATGTASGFTEIPRRRALGEDRGSRRSRRSAGSGSTVWSAGIQED